MVSDILNSHYNIVSVSELLITTFNAGEEKTICQRCGSVLAKFSNFLVRFGYVRLFSNWVKRGDFFVGTRNRIKLIYRSWLRDGTTGIHVNDESYRVYQGVYRGETHIISKS